MAFKSFCLVVLVLFVSSSCNNEKKKKGHLVEGNKFLNEKNYKKARKHYQWALQLDSCYSDALSNLGVVEEMEGNTSEALHYFDAALNCDPTFYGARVNRARWYMETQNREQALTDLRFLTRTYSDSLSPWFSRLAVATESNLWQEAFAVCDSLTLKNAAPEEIALNKANIFFLQGEYEKALSLFVSVSSPNLEGFRRNGEALVYSEQAQQALALEKIEMALQKEPENPIYLNNKGLILLRKGDVKSGLEMVNKSLILNPKNPYVYATKGYYYYLEEEYNKALQLMLRAEQMDDKIHRLGYWIASVYLKLGDQENACKYYLKSENQRFFTDFDTENCK